MPNLGVTDVCSDLGQKWGMFDQKRVALDHMVAGQRSYSQVVPGVANI